MRRNDPRFVLAFAIPTSSPGLKVICREPVNRWFGSWGHPFNMLDEQDCMLFFKNVLVPWDRLFMLYQAPAGGLYAQVSPDGANLNFAGWANLTRVHYRSRW
jgi:aromatic ring hydroxylase